MATNTSVLSYGSLFQIGNGVIGAGTTQVSTLAFGGPPTAGSVTLGFWGLTTAPIVTTSLPTAGAVATAINNLFGTAYVNPFTVTVATNTFTVTADPAGPFAFMPLPPFTVVTNTSLQTLTSTITVPGVTKETYATVSGVETFPFPAPTAAVETYMTYDTGNNRYVSKMKKFKNGGTLAMTLVMRNDATQNIITGLQSLFESPSAYDFRVSVPTQVANPSLTVPGYVDYFTAFVTGYSTPSNTPDGRMRINVPLDVDGAVLRFPPLL